MGHLLQTGNLLPIICHLPDRGAAEAAVVLVEAGAEAEADLAEAGVAVAVAEEDNNTILQTQRLLKTKTAA